MGSDYISLVLENFEGGPALRARVCRRAERRLWGTGGIERFLRGDWVRGKEGEPSPCGTSPPILPKWARALFGAES